MFRTIFNTEDLTKLTDEELQNRLNRLSAEAKTLENMDQNATYNPEQNDRNVSVQNPIQNEFKAPSLSYMAAYFNARRQRSTTPTLPPALQKQTPQKN